PFAGHQFILSSGFLSRVLRLGIKFSAAPGLIPCGPLLTDANRMRQMTAGALVLTSFQLLSCVEVIVPARFRKMEGLSGDDAEEVRPIICDKLSQRDVAGNGPRGPRWPGNSGDRTGEAWNTARPSGDGA
ncbi:MAG: hypothetical protein ABSB76_33470, partial [Streptosporangiaceae bacterium]